MRRHDATPLSRSKPFHRPYQSSSAALDPEFERVNWPSCLMRLRLTVFDLGIQHRPGRKNTVADALSRLQAEFMDETDMEDDIPEYYVEHIDAIFLVGNIQRTDEGLVKPTMDDLLREQRGDTLCHELLMKTDESDSPYLLDERGVISGRSRLDGSIQSIIPTTLRQSLLYSAHHPDIMADDGCTTR